MVIKIMSAHTPKPMQTIENVIDFKIVATNITNYSKLIYKQDNKIEPTLCTIDFDENLQYITIFPDNYSQKKDYKTLL